MSIHMSLHVSLERPVPHRHYPRQHTRTLSIRMSIQVRIRMSMHHASTSRPVYAHIYTHLYTCLHTSSRMSIHMSAHVYTHQVSTQRRGPRAHPSSSPPEPRHLFLCRSVPTANRRGAIHGSTIHVGNPSPRRASRYFPIGAGRRRSPSACSEALKKSALSRDRRGSRDDRPVKGRVTKDRKGTNQRVHAHTHGRARMHGSALLVP